MMPSIQAMILNVQRMFTKQPRVFVIYVEFTDKHQSDGLKILIPWVERVLPGLESEFLVVDNARTGKNESFLEKNVKIIVGDNSGREFSGFDKGVRWFQEKHEVRDEDIFIFVNESFFRSYGTEYLDWFSPDLVSGSLQQNRIVGYVDAFPEEVEALGIKFRSWARTSLLLLNYFSLKKLLPFAVPCSDEQLFSKDGGEFFLADAPVSENYKQFLRTWLFGEVREEAVFREVWHAHKGLMPGNRDLFRAKAKAILCEHFFSARAKKLGIVIDDVCQYRNMRQYGEIPVSPKTILLIAVSSDPFPIEDESKLEGKGHKPLGILSLATYLKEVKGFSVICIDQRIEDPLVFIRKNHRMLLFIGLSVMSADYSAAKEILRNMKKVCPDLPCVIGGAHPSAVYQDVIRDGFDLAAIGEGEILCGEIADIFQKSNTPAKRKKDFSKIPGVAFRNKKGEIIVNPRSEFIDDLDILPIIDRSFLESPKYSAERMTVSTSRGCPGRCLFCQSGPNLFGRKIRQRSVRSVIDEIKNLLRSGCNFITFLDDCLLWNEGWVREFCHAVKEEKLRFTWLCETRAQFITEPVIKTIIEAGCRGLNIGFESGSDNTLKFLRKGSSVAAYKKSVEILKRYGLHYGCYVITGSPHETKDDLEATIQFIKEIRPDPVAVSRLTPIYGSELFNYLSEKNMISDANAQAYYQNRYPIKCDYLTAEDLDEYEVEIYKAMYIPGALPEELRGDLVILEDAIPARIVSDERCVGMVRIKNLSNFHWIAYPDPVRVSIEDLRSKKSRDNFYQQIEGHRVELYFNWFDTDNRLVQRVRAGNLIGNVSTGECGTFVLEYQAPDGFTGGYLEYDLVLPEVGKRLAEFGYKPFRRSIEVIPELVGEKVQFHGVS